MGDMADHLMDSMWEDDFDPSENWDMGYHETRDGDRIRITKMSDSHLQNTINYFKNEFDTSILQKELDRRKKHNG